MKKILILLIPLVFLMPIMAKAEEIKNPEPYHYNNGLLDDELILGDHNLEPEFFDNDTNTSQRATKTYFINFKSPVYIDVAYFKTVRQSGSGIGTYYYLNDIDEISQMSFHTKDEYIDIKLDNVIRIEFKQTSASGYHVIYELDFFGSYNKGANPEIPEVKEIKNIKIESDPDRVNLSWELPETDLFEHVNIYRKDLGKNEQEISFFDFLKPMTVHASNDDFRAIFETNGTYFNDLTVEENSKYEYKLTTEYQGLESQGVIVQATTPISPAPPLEGGGGEQQANGDYLFKWESPREGQVRIFVDGNEYATVEASTGQLLVPGSDMKYSPLGKPLISYQTIGLNGEESNITSPDIGNLENPVKPGEVVKTGSDLLMYIAPYLMLALSIPLSFRLIKALRMFFDKDEREKSYYRHVNRKWEKEQRKAERQEYREMQRDIRTMARPPRTRGRRA